MKKNILLTIVTVVTFLLVSCDTGLTVHEDKPENMAKIVVNTGVDTSFRDIYPTGEEIEITSFGGFTLTAKNVDSPENEDPIYLVGDLSHNSSSLPWTFELPVGTYDFYLRAYKRNGDTSRVEFSDTKEDVTLKANTVNKLNFTLRPANEAESGILNIILKFDNSEGLISQIKAHYEPEDDLGFDNSTFTSNSDFYSTNDELISFWLPIVPEGEYDVHFEFYTQGSENPIEEYVIPAVHVYGGFTTLKTETIKLNPIYTVTYQDALDGTPDFEKQTRYSRFSEFQLPSLSKENRQFNGWIDSANPNGGYVDEVSKGTRGDKTFVANWQKQKITYSSAHGTAPATQNVYWGEQLVEAYRPNLTAEGWNFKGWLLDGEPIDADDEISITDDISLVADWKQLFTVSYSTAHGTAPTAQTVEDGTTLTSDYFPELSADGWVFKGWKLSNELVNADDEVSVTDSITLVAVWEQIHPVTFHYEKDGTDELEYETTTVNYYESDNQAFLDEFTTISADEFVLSPDNTWYSEGITTEEIAALVEDEEAFDIYYDRVYYIEYNNDENGATLIGNYVPSYTRNTPDFDLPVFEKEDYVFLGWYKTSDLVGSGATAVPKNGATPITSVPTGTRGSFDVQAIWKNKTNTGISINLPEDDDTFNLSDTYQIKCTPVSGGGFKIQILPKDSITDSEERIQANSQLGNYTYKWNIDGSLVADATTSEFTMAQADCPTFTPNSIHNALVAATKDGKTYTLSQEIQLADE